MKIEFEAGAPTQVLFKEKHLLTVTQDITAETLVEAANKNTRFRTLVGKKVNGNSILGMTLAQQEMLFSWLIKNKESVLSKIKKGDAPLDIEGIPVYGCVIFKDTVRIGGSLTLGLQRKTGTVLIISHFGRHDWTGSTKLLPNATVKAT